MADLIQYIKEEASRNLRLAEKTKGSRQRTHSIRAKHLQRAVAEIERLTTERDTAEANLERLQNKFEQVTGENVRLTAEVKNARLQVCQHLYISGSPVGMNRVYCGSCKKEYMIPSKAFVSGSPESKGGNDRE